MRFMILLKADKNTETGIPPSTELIAAMMKYNEELTKAGVLLAGEGYSRARRGRTSNSPLANGPSSTVRSLSSEN